MMPDSFSDVFTFLMTDIEGSTRLWESHANLMQQGMQQHDLLASSIIARYSGELIKSRGEGDSVFAVFPNAQSAVSAAVDFQLAIQEQLYPILPLKARIALHHGTAQRRGGDLFGPAINRCARIRSTAHGGQILVSSELAGKAREEATEIELMDLGIHGLRDLSPEHIFQVMHPKLPQNFPPLNSLQVCRSNLSIQSTPFLGRLKELNALKSLILASPLVTVLGTGGIGKTRLALKAAEDIMLNFDHGVWVTELALVTDETTIMQSICSSLGISAERGTVQQDTLINTLRDQQILLVWDNCEHLVESCAYLAQQIISRCRNVKILITSRERLQIPGESILNLKPLELVSESSIINGFKYSESAAFFLSYACMHNSMFQITQHSIEYIELICKRLDGIPLAIELAAARTRVMDVAQIHDRLSDRFKLLTDGMRGTIPRQQTLRATIQWSFNLLTTEEHTMMMMLSFFVGGASLEAVEGICAQNAQQRDDALNVLTSLVDKSLLLFDVQSDRYQMLETILAYAKEEAATKLSPEITEEFLSRFCNWYTSFVQQTGTKMVGSDQVEWHRMLDLEHANLRLTLNVLYKRDDKDSIHRALWIADSLSRYWGNRGFWREGLEITLSLLNHPEAAPQNLVRARALAGAGSLANLLGDYAMEEQFQKESYEICKEHSALNGMANALVGLGTISMHKGDYCKAEKLFKESQELYTLSNDHRSLAYCLINLASIYLENHEMATVRIYLSNALKSLQKIGDTRGLAIVYLKLGELEIKTGDEVSAVEYISRSHSLFRSLNHIQGTASTLINSAWLIHRGVMEGSISESIQQSLELALKSMDMSMITETVEICSEIAFERGYYLETAELFGCEDYLLSEMQSELSSSRNIEREDFKLAITKIIGESLFFEARERGYNMDIQQAVSFTIEVIKRCELGNQPKNEDITV